MAHVQFVQAGTCSSCQSGQQTKLRRQCISGCCPPSNHLTPSVAILDQSKYCVPDCFAPDLSSKTLAYRGILDLVAAMPMLADQGETQAEA